MLLTGTHYWCVTNHLPGTHVTCVLPRTIFPHPCRTYVNAAEHPSVYLCPYPSIHTCTKSTTHLQLASIMCTPTHKETHPDTIPETSKQSRSPKNHRMCISRCCRAGIHIYKQGFAHTHTYKCSHNHTNNSRKIVRYGIGSLTKRCMSMILIIIKLVCYPLCESQPRKWHFRCSA